MAKVIQGRFAIGHGKPGARLVVVRADNGQRVPLDEDGRFTIIITSDEGVVDSSDGARARAVTGVGTEATNTTTEGTGRAGNPPTSPSSPSAAASAEPIVLLLRQGPGLVSEVVLDPADINGEVVVLAPEPTADPRRKVRSTIERLNIDRQARETARKALGKQMASRAIADEKIDAVLKAILDDIAGNRGGDTRWRLPLRGADAPEALKAMTIRAVQAAKTQLDGSGPTLLAKPGTFAASQRIATGRLVSELVSTAELVRRPALDIARIRSIVQGKDGLPAELTTPTQPNGTGSSPGSPASASLLSGIDGKLAGMVDAMRLPEDPPLLQADSAVSGTGAAVELAKGVADAVAFHDVHELALAMPSVWTDVFDRRFVDILREALKELATAGVAIEPLAQLNDGSAARTLAGKLRTVADAYAETAVGALRSARAAARPGVLDVPGGLTGSAHGIVARRISDEMGPQIGLPGGLAPADPEPDPVPPRDPFPDEDPSDEEPPPEPQRGPMGLLEELESYLAGNHSFTIFPALGAQRSLNFGVLLTWRQRWEPLSYQTGEIAHTTTLAPAERRRMVTRRVQRLKRYTSEAEKSMQARMFQTAETSRAETEILRKADATTNFELTSDGSTKMLVENGSFSTTATRDVTKAGTDTRRRFREAVVKATQEYREEHAIEVRSESEASFEEEVTSEVVNPNNELAVTAVFYTLQRRYEVSEHLYRARPVVMVAMPVPNPAQLTTAWLVRHAWIIERCLLAERFRTALTYLTSSFLGDTEALSALNVAVEDQRVALAAAQERLSLARTILESRGQTLRDVRRAIAEGEPAGFGDLPVVSLVRDVYNFVGSIFGGGDDEAETRERNEMVLAAAEDELERAERESREAESQLVGATSAYQDAVRAYTEAKRVQRNHEVRIAELRVHVSDNILHYMQAIWSTEPPDQRFFNLHAIQVPELTDEVVVTSTGNAGSPGVGGFTPDEFTINFTQGNQPLTFRPLAEVAELDHLLGFKGNYALFPMRDGNALTDVVLAPYLDSHEVLRDPSDPAANWTIEELREYADRLRAMVLDNSMTQADFDTKYVPFLRDTLERLITDPRPSVSTLVVPTDSLYVELLTSGGSLIEPFKKEHRSLDVARARAEIREMELENLRRALRLANGELADPSMDDFERHLVRADTTTENSGDDTDDSDGNGG